MAISGRMDRRIIIEQWGEDSPAFNSYGEPSGSWTTFITCWAQKRDRSGREFFVSGTVSEATVIFRIRYVSGINTKMRISYDSEYYNILSIAEYGREDSMELMAKVQE
jgi:SPP1 family predicted phage head-tail adaptor